MEQHRQDLEFIWPGEAGFAGFPRSIPDDCIEYGLYIIDATFNNAHQTRNRLGELQKHFDQLLKIHLKGYIWQKEGFNLKLAYDDGHLKLQGRTIFGESIADEWVIVFLLVEASKKFPQAWIRCTDADGEFFLVEAANELPAWLNPEVAANRVWINQGRLLIIPRFSSKDLKKVGPNISLDEALDLISEQPETLLHSLDIERAALRRIREYPEKIKEHFHATLVTVPRKIALILSQLPASMTPAVDAFYLRDPVVLRPLRRGRSDALSFPPLDPVTISAKFTRVSFAQLKSQEFSPPEAWERFTSEHSNSLEQTQREIGMKLTCGFEMLLADPQKSNDKIVRIIRVLLDDLDTDQDLMPSNEEIESWPKTEENEAWLDVDYEDFERELSGDPRPRNPTGAGFGDKTAQENLRNIVKRFDEFLKDNSAGVDGAQVEDDMDQDNDSDGSGPTNDSGDEDQDYDEIVHRAQESVSVGDISREELANAFKYLMDLPVSETTQPDTSSHYRGDNPNVKSNSSREYNRDDEGDIEDMMKQMEEELQHIGALNFASHESSPDSDPHYQLAKNLLAGFKGQAGAPGPIGNLMGAMGLHLPRDEVNEDDRGDSK